MFDLLRSILSDKKDGELFTCFSTWHFAFLAIFVVAFVVLFFVLKNKSSDFRNKALDAIVGVAFGLYMLDFFLMPFAYGAIEIEKLPYAINSKLKKSILIKDAEEVDERFHSRYSVHSKTYRYTINNSKFGTAIFRDMEYHFPIELDEKLMAEAAKYLVGKHDFSSFKSSNNLLQR